MLCALAHSIAEKTQDFARNPVFFRRGENKKRDSDALASPRFLFSAAISFFLTLSHPSLTLRECE